MALPAVCRLCGSSSESLSVTTPHVYGDQSRNRAFINCERCGVHFLYPPLSPEEESHFYRREFESFMDQRAGHEGGWRDPKDHVVANAPQVSRRARYLYDVVSGPSDILEVGCSSGFMLFDLINRGHSCVGIEPSGVFNAFLTESGISVFQSIEELYDKEPNKRFDLIMHFFVLEHLADPLEAISRQLSLLRPNGKLVVEIPNSADPLRSVYDLPAFERFYWSIAHHWYWNEQSLTWLFNQLPCQFTLVRDQRYDLSNHLNWAITGKPGGQGLYREIFGEGLDDAYRNRLIETGNCDTLIAIVTKSQVG
jgi:SAM-dependent methyltransferase